MLQTEGVLLQRPWGVPGRSRNRKEACAAGVTVVGGGQGHSSQNLAFILHNGIHYSVFDRR